jgi:hypothetical protein
LGGLSLAVWDVKYREEGSANDGERWSCIDELKRRK